MVKIIRLAVLAATLLASDSWAAGCPSGYPADFPCIVGGSTAGLPTLQRSPTGPREVFSIAYRQDPVALYNAVITGAEAQGWTVSARSQGREAGGLRYRAGFEKGKAGWTIVVYGTPEKTIFQLSKW